MENQPANPSAEKSANAPANPQSNYPPPSNYTAPPQNQQIGIKQQPAAMPPPGSYGPPAASGPQRMFATNKLPRLLFWGILLMFIGAVIIVAVSTSGPPNSYDPRYDDNEDGVMDADQDDNWNRDRQTYDMIKDIGVTVGKILGNLGLVLTVAVLLIGGFVNYDIDKHIRIGMIIAAGLIIGWTGMTF